MSSSDYISIIKNMEGKFVVKHKDADTHDLLEMIGEKDNLEDAVQLANEWQDGEGNQVEYGLVIPNPKGK